MNIAGVVLLAYLFGIFTYVLIDFMKKTNDIEDFNNARKVLFRWFSWPYHGIKFLVNFIGSKVVKK